MLDKHANNIFIAGLKTITFYINIYDKRLKK